MTEKVEIYVELGEVCRNRLNMQCQYGSRYADNVWHPEYLFCGENLRITGSTKIYHSMTIHEDDVDEFVRRVQQVLSVK